MDGHGEFLWGVSTSAYQSEGGYNGHAQPCTNWGPAEERGDVAKSGRASDFWTRYGEDFEHCRRMGLNAFRLGIEWSRVQPTFNCEEKREPPPRFDAAALAHYAKILAECRAQKLEPVVTLHHFTHPAWLGADPWVDPATPALFETFVRETVTTLNEKLIA